MHTTQSKGECFIANDYPQSHSISSLHTLIMIHMITFGLSSGGTLAGVSASSDDFDSISYSKI